MCMAHRLRRCQKRIDNIFSGAAALAALRGAIKRFFVLLKISIKFDKNRTLPP